MIQVAQAEKIVLEHTRDYGAEEIHFQDALGRILAEDIVADRDMPAFNRATMDGIAIQYEAIEKGMQTFTIKGMQAAGEVPIQLNGKEDCIEIMTGAAVPDSADIVVRYEDISINDGVANLQTNNIKKGQNIHRKGIDKKEGDIVVSSNTIITPAVISAAAFTGKEKLSVKKAPRIVTISNGDELEDIGNTPPPYKIRRSNSYTIQAALQQNKLEADILHLPDDENIIETEIKKCLEQYDVIIVSGGISMGKFDLVGKVLEKLSVQQLFHKVQQRPGKPFWFGVHENGPVVFAFPGNPVSTFMCFYRYFMPWWKKSMGITEHKLFAKLASDIHFAPSLQYFVQVKLEMDETAQLIATPAQGNGSGDLANLTETDAYMELPAELSNFKKGDVFRVWPFKTII